MKKCSINPFLSAVMWLTLVAVSLYVFFTVFNLNEIFGAMQVLLVPLLLLLVTLPALILGVYYLRKAVLGKRVRQHVRFL